MPDEADPPRKYYGFKEASFERLNPSRPAATPAGKSPTQPADPNDVFTILKRNQAVADRAGLNEVESRKVSSRRARDYWFILLASEAFFGAFALIGRGNAIVFVCAISGMALVAIGITWIMWQVMGKY